MSVLMAENVSRKLDNLGRVVIPKNLRAKFNIQDSDEIQFLTLEHEGRYYICLTNGKTMDPKYQTTIDVLTELGLEIPEELTAMLE